MKFRKKPVEIDAVQFTGERPWPDGVHASTNPRERGEPMCWTLEGPLRVSVGDWIIKGVKGEFYPCKPDVFAMTYEPVNPSIAQPSVEEGPRPEGPAWGVLHKVADAFEGSVLLHDMNEEEREAVEEAFCLARGVSNAAPPPEAPARCPECEGYGKRPVYSAGEEMVAGFEPCRGCGGTGTKGGGKP